MMTALYMRFYLIALFSLSSVSVKFMSYRVFGVYDRGCNHTYSNVRKLSFDLRLALAGGNVIVRLFTLSLNLALISFTPGIAGGISTLILHPIDTYKTMLQADMTVSSIRTAFQRLKERGFSKAYSGSVAAVLGAIPSSSLYFGTYEFSKKLYGDFLFPLSNRALIHMMSAASGNIISSLIFVPKEVVKQKLQALKTSAVTTPIDSTTIVSVMNSIFRQRGLKGFYSGYRATLFRNIPSAIIRFTLYEELKLLLAKNEKMRDNRWHDLCYLFAGSLASSVSTALTTPIDVIKTRMAVESIPSGTNFITAFKLIAKREGLRSLFTGVKARIVWSSLYGGIGLFCFEQCKKLLQVED
jgi:solute carrier family 25 S-adenosylmethionine transporter 26